MHWTTSRFSLLRRVAPFLLSTGLSLAACSSEEDPVAPENLEGINAPDAGESGASPGEESEGVGQEDPSVQDDENAPPGPAAQLQPQSAQLATGTGDASGQYVATDREGNRVVAFIYDGATTFQGTPLSYQGQTGTYVALARVGANGAVSWAKGFGAAEAGGGSSGNTSINALAVGPSGEIFIGGTLQGYDETPAVLNLGGAPLSAGTFLAKFSADGTHQWSRNTRPENGVEFIFTDFAADPNGDVVALASFGPTAAQAMVVRYRGGDGEPQWTRLYGPANNPNSSVVGRSIAVDQNSRPYVVGAFTGTASFGKATYTARVITLDDGGLVAGAPFVIALSEGGEVRWSRRLAEHGEGLNVSTREGHLMVALDRVASAKPFASRGYLLSLDLSGRRRWEKAIGTFARAVHLGPYREVVVAGPGPAAELGVAEPAPDGSSAYVAKFNRVNGELLKVAQIPAGLNDLSVGWTTGHVSAVGEFKGRIDLGTGPVQSRGGSDGYLLQLSP
ncbi:MAG TPA: SBBP repeat-containing protein [Myxococcaceae bacterium]|nr:SBBP repeat-containing protein [Myxococcaceae bacterium]